MVSTSKGSPWLPTLRLNAFEMQKLHFTDLSPSPTRIEFQADFLGVGAGENNLYT